MKRRDLLKIVLSSATAVVGGAVVWELLQPKKVKEFQNSTITPRPTRTITNTPTTTTTPVPPDSEKENNDMDQKLLMIITATMVESYPSPGYVTGADKLTNSDFETAGGGGADVFSWWTEFVGTGAITQDTTTFYSGAKSLKLLAGSTKNTYLNSPNVTVTPGQPYLWTFYTYGDGSNDGKYSVYDITHSKFLLQGHFTRHAGTSFRRREVLFIPPAGCTAVQLFFLCPAVDTGFVINDLSSLKTWTPPSYFYDNFARSDGDPWASPGGFPYQLVNVGGLGNLVIANQILTIPAGTTGAAYAFIDFPTAPTKILSEFFWSDDSTGDGDSAVICASNDILRIRAYNHMVHFIVTQKLWRLETWDDAGAITVLGSGVLDLALNTRYRMSISVSGDTATLEIPSIANQVITDASLGTYYGQYMYYELLRTASTKRTPNFTKWEVRY